MSVSQLAIQNESMNPKRWYLLVSLGEEPNLVWVYIFLKGAYVTGKAYCPLSGP